ELGEYALSFLTSEIISRKMSELAGAGDERVQLEEGQKPNRPKSRKTLKHYRDTLDVLLKHAQKWGWIGQNPMDGVNRITKQTMSACAFSMMTNARCCWKNAKRAQTSSSTRLWS